MMPERSGQWIHEVEPKWERRKFDSGVSFTGTLNQGQIVAQVAGAWEPYSIRLVVVLQV